MCDPGAQEFDHGPAVGQEAPGRGGPAVIADLDADAAAAQYGKGVLVGVVVAQVHGQHAGGLVAEQFQQGRALVPAGAADLDAAVEATALQAEVRGAYAACEWTNDAAELVELGERLCRHVGVDVIPRDKLFFTRDLADGTLAVTVTATREVWFSTKLLMMGRDEFLAGYLEEAVHAMTGLADETRAFQNVFIGLVVRLGLRAC